MHFQKSGNPASAGPDLEQIGLRPALAVFIKTPAMSPTIHKGQGPTAIKIAQRQAPYS